MGIFQTKDGPCLLYELDWWDTNNFYTSCDHCRTWVEFTLEKRPNRKLKLEDYKKEVKKTTKKDDEQYKKDMEKLFGKLRGGVKKNEK